MNIVARVGAMLSMCRNVLMFRPPLALTPTTLIYSPLEMIIRQLVCRRASPLPANCLELLRLRTVSPRMTLVLLLGAQVDGLRVKLSILRRLLMTSSVVQHPLILLRNGPLECRMHVDPRLYIISFMPRLLEVVVLVIRLTMRCAMLKLMLRILMIPLLSVIIPLPLVTQDSLFLLRTLVVPLVNTPCSAVHRCLDVGMNLMLWCPSWVSTG